MPVCGGTAEASPTERPGQNEVALMSKPLDATTRMLI
jgi:hypothetical protein